MRKLKKVWDADKMIWLLIIFFFCIYLFWGLNFSTRYETYLGNDFFFDADTERALVDMSIFEGDHHRVRVHPLFVIAIQPIILLMTVVTSEPLHSILILQSLAAAASVGLLYSILNDITTSRKTSFLLSCIYGFSFTNLIFSAIPETFIFSGFLLLLLWKYVFKLSEMEDEPSRIQLMLLILLGISSVAITVTNIVHYVIAVIFIYSRKGKKKTLMYKLNRIVFCLAASLFIASVLSFVQKSIWNSCDFFMKYLLNILDRTSFSNTDESLFIDFNITWGTLKNSLIHLLGIDFVSSKIILSDKLMIFGNMTFFSFIAFLMISCLFIFSLYKAITGKHQGFALAMFLTVAANFCLHLVYGNISVFLYSQHYTFLIVMIIGLGLASIQEKYELYWRGGIFSYLCIEIVINCISLYTMLHFASEVYSPQFVAGELGEKYMVVILKTLFILIPVIAIWLLNTKKYKIYISLALTSILTLVGCYRSESNDYFEKMAQSSDSLQDYMEEYDQFIEAFKIEKVKVNPKETAFYFFGMGNREKMIYQDGSLVRVDDGEVLYQWDISSELILPHEYKVILQDTAGNLITISEDQNSVKIKNRDGQWDVENTISDICLPDFNEYHYPYIMKVLHHELLINIKDSIPYRNFMVYPNSNYQDSMMIGMVLKETGNTKLIEDYIMNLDYCYDKPMNSKKTDNLGQALYLISLISERNHPLIPKILNEVDQIKFEDKTGMHIMENPGFSDRLPYQISCLNLGMQSLGFEDRFVIPDGNFSYQTLAWWDGTIAPGIELDDDSYPYLNWASYHKNGEGKLYIANTIYPLTWERRSGQVEYDNINVINADHYYFFNKVLPAHGRMAAEMMLLLFETKDN